MGIRNPQQTLDQLYAVRDDLLTGKLQNYTIGDRTINLFNLKDLDLIIQHWESAVTANQPIISDNRGTGAEFGGSNPFYGASGTY